MGLSQALQENFCRVADLLQLFYRPCGPKGEVWLYLESCPQRGMAGVGVRLGRVGELGEEGRRPRRDANRGLGTRV